MTKIITGTNMDAMAEIIEMMIIISTNTITTKTNITSINTNTIAMKTNITSINTNTAMISMGTANITEEHYAKKIHPSWTSSTEFLWIK